MKILFVHQFITTGQEPGEARHLALFKRMLADGFTFHIIGGSLSYLTGKTFPGFSGFRKKIDLGENGIVMERVKVASTYRSGFFGRMLCYLSFLITATWASLGVKDTDMLLTTSPSLFTALAGYLISRIKKVPFWLEIRDLWPRAPVEMGALKNKTIIDFSYRLEKFLCEKADRVIVITPGYAEYIESLGIPAEKIRVLPNGVDPEFLEYERPSSPPDGINPGDKFRLFYLGAMGKFNQLDHLIDLAGELADMEGFRLYFLGDGAERPHLEEEAVKRDLKNVTFLGSRPRGEVPELLSWADAGVVIYPPIPLSKLLLMNKVLDFMSLGIPLFICAPEGDTSRVIEESGGGVLLGSPGEIPAAVRKAYGDRESLGIMGRMARKYVSENLSRPKLAKDLEKILNEREKS